ncbi:hypothetical protein RDMS_04850 [Deinococcus sp. RL]|nr:hypothetical protein RDMS_04850 [Deinococcus sp. RL]
MKRWAGDVQERYHLQEDDVVIAMDRPWIEAGLKWAWIQKQDLPAYLVQRVARLRATEGLDQKFLRYVIASPDFTAYIKPIVTGATVPHISGGQIEAHRFPVPPLPTQRKIAAILSAYDDLIENNTRRVRVLEEMARALYREWFVEFRFPGHEQAEFVEDEQGRRPKGWVVQTVAQTFSILGGATPSKAEPEFWEGGDINWYTPSDITKSGRVYQDESQALITFKGLSRSSATLFPAYSVMMTSRATIGAIGINTTPATVNQGFIVGLPNERFPLQVMRQWFAANVEQFIGLASGATFKEISKSTFKAINVVVPPAELVHRFEAAAATWGRAVENLERRNANLRRTRDLLLPRLVSGELDVSALNVRGPGLETEDEQTREEAVA